MQTNTAKDRTKARTMQTIPFPWKIVAQLTLRAMGMRCQQCQGPRLWP